MIRKIFLNSFFTEFNFHTSFELKFHREDSIELYGKPFPIEFKFSILTDWWFGVREEWNEKVKRLTNGLDMIEPDEPVLAYELAWLRWTDGANIEDVVFEDDYMKIMFKCGKSIAVPYLNEMDFSWEISACNTNAQYKGWSIICEEGRFYINIPQ